MNYQRLIIELPILPDEAAAYLHKFIEALMHAIDDQYYQQMHRYYANQLTEMIKNSQIPITQETLDEPPF